MGAWSEDAFGNDTACDWGSDLEDETDLTFVSDTLEDTVDEEDYLDSDDACEALAACEVIARLKGNWGVRNSYTETVDKWVETHPQTPPPELVQLAAAAIDRILAKDSELRELWDESGEDNWLNSVNELRRRVTS